MKKTVAWVALGAGLCALMIATSVVHEVLISPKTASHGPIEVLVYEIDPAGLPADGPIEMGAALAFVERRLDGSVFRGIEARQVNATQIELRLPEAKRSEVERLQRLLSPAGTLEFRILADADHDESVIDQATKQPSDVVRNAKGEVVGRWARVQAAREARLPIHPNMVTRAAAEDGSECLEVLMLGDHYNVSGRHLLAAKPEWDVRGRLGIGLTLDSEGAQDLAKLVCASRSHESDGFEDMLGLIVGGELVLWASLDGAISERMTIWANYDPAETEEILDTLNGSSLPLTLRPAASTSVPHR